MTKKDDKVRLAPFQIFVLSYLYSEELNIIKREQRLDEQRLATHHLQSSILRSPLELRIRELTTILPSTVIDENLTTEEMIRQLTLLVNYRFLESNNLYNGEYATFSIMNDGMLCS